MAAISSPPEVRAPRAEVKKLIRMERSTLKLIERAARKLKPRPSSSWFIVEAARKYAERVLAS